jgi:hypothetical protein
LNIHVPKGKRVTLIPHSASCERHLSEMQWKFKNGNEGEKLWRAFCPNCQASIPVREDQAKRLLAIYGGHPGLFSVNKNDGNGRIS